MEQCTKPIYMYTLVLFIVSLYRTKKLLPVLFNLKVFEIDKEGET